VYLPTDIDGLAARFAADRPELLLLAYEKETRALGPVLREALDCAGGAGPPRTAAILIGPEGGLEASEAARMAEAGFLPVSLGPRVLRAETAGPVLLTMLLYELGDLGGFVR
jgi:16S rRNA (uracil1498-N3)-methyltransferase